MNRQSMTISAVILAVVVVVFGIFVYLRGGPGAGPEPITGPGRAGEARGIIAEIEERRAGNAAPAAATREPELISERAAGASGPASGAVAVTPEPAATVASGAEAELDEAYQRALELRGEGRLDDAQVLLFYGARQGHARSAFAYAEMNDPNYHSSESSLLPEPDAFQAYRWYSAALEGGVEDAAGRLESLRRWAVDAAAAGDGDAERLLLQWER